MLLNLERARERLARDNVDAWVCVLPKHVYYLSDYESDWLFDFPWVACAILPRDPSISPALIVHDVELTNLAEKPSWIPLLRAYFASIDGSTYPHYVADETNVLEPLEEGVLRSEAEYALTGETSCLSAAISTIRSLGLGSSRIGFDDLRFRDACCSALPEITGVDAIGSLLWTRQIKSPAELQLMEEAARRNQRAVESALAACRTGATWRAVRRAYCVSAAREDCCPASFFVGAGRKSMGIWSDYDYPIQRSEPICIDAMLTFRRYFGDVQRTAVIGVAPEKLHKYWKAVQTAAAECYSEMKPGVSTADLRQRAIRTARKLGIPHFRHAFVHGLGLDHLELPGEGRTFGAFTLEAGMLVNMDLEVCELGFGGVYFEETMRITASGAEPLYSLPRELISLSENG
jgi:Xaa-Pro aminopeptidase